MREPTKESPLDRGEVELKGSCQLCGAEGRVVAVPGAAPPNAFCARCAIEYAEVARDDDEV